MYAVNAELPEHVQGALPVPAQTRFRLAANEVLVKGATAVEAHAAGWNRVKEDWEPAANGWIRKYDKSQLRDKYGKWSKGSDSVPASATKIGSSVSDGRAGHTLDLYQDEDKLLWWKSGDKAGGPFKSVHSIAMDAQDAGVVVPDQPFEQAVHDKIAKVKLRTLYVRRDVLNGKDIVRWAKEQGFETTMKPEDMHVTIIYSKAPVDWMKFSAQTWGDGTITVPEGGLRVVEPLGDGGAVVLMFNCDELTWRNEYFRREGASWDYHGYQPHITITWNKDNTNLTEIEPYQGKILLGPEIFEEVKENWKDNLVEKFSQEMYVLQDAALIEKATVVVSRNTKGNPYHAQDGKFTTGPSGHGGREHLAHIAGRAALGAASGAAAGAAISATSDWFVGESGAKHPGWFVDETGLPHIESAAQIHNRLSNEQTFAKISRSVAKELLHAALGLGIEIVVAATIGKAVRMVMPFLSGSTKMMANTAASVMLGRASAATSTSLRTMYETLTRALRMGLDKKMGVQTHGPVFVHKAAGKITEKDLELFQMLRLQSVLREIDPTELGVQRAEAHLKLKDPEFLDRLKKDLDEAFADVVAAPVEATVVKVDRSLGLVFGWAIICKHNGEDYFDLNIDKSGERVPEHVTEAAMLDAATDFMANSRMAKEMHVGEGRGDVVFAFPLTTEIAKAMGINSSVTGLMIAMKPDNQMLEKFASGELRGFSIGGSRIKAEELD